MTPARLRAVGRQIVGQVGANAKGQLAAPVEALVYSSMVRAMVSRR